MIRQAEPRDVAAIEALFHQLLDYLREKGQTLYSQDEKILRNGVAGFIIGSLFDENSRVLVHEDPQGQVAGFMMGRLVQHPPFFAAPLVGEITWTYPLSLETRNLARAFERWGRRKGANGTGNYHTPGNGFAAEMFAHDGRKVIWHYYFKPLKTDRRGE